jgi:preprotein translocase subunit SecD
MKYKIRTILYLALCLFAACGSNEKVVLEDGLYPVVIIDTNANNLSTLTEHQQALFFSKMFDDYNEEGYRRIIIDASDYVPLELSKAPLAEQQTESKKKLLLTLNKSASEKLKTFSAQHLNKEVAIVVDGEVLTMHKIKVVLTSGQLQITRCYDNACEQLFVKLQDNIKE